MRGNQFLRKRVKKGILEDETIMRGRDPWRALAGVHLSPSKSHSSEIDETHSRAAG